MNKNTIDTKYIKLGKVKFKVFFILFIFCEVGIKIGKDFSSAIHFVALNWPGGKGPNFFKNFFFLSFCAQPKVVLCYKMFLHESNVEYKFYLIFYLNNRICSIYGCGFFNNILFPLDILFRMRLGMILENIFNISNT